MQAFRIGKMAANDEFTNGGLSLVDTVQRKLLDDLEGLSPVICRTLMVGLVVSCSYCKNARDEGGRGLKKINIGHAAY